MTNKPIYQCTNLPIYQCRRTCCPCPPAARRPSRPWPGRTWISWPRPQATPCHCETSAPPPACGAATSTTAWPSSATPAQRSCRVWRPSGAARPARACLRAYPHRQACSPDGRLPASRPVSSSSSPARARSGWAWDGSFCSKSQSSAKPWSGVSRPYTPTWTGPCWRSWPP